MNVTQAMQFVIWAGTLRGQGANLTPAEAADRWGISRATAYRWIAAYFDAQGWAWPRTEQAMESAEGRASQAERSATIRDLDAQRMQRMAA